MDDEDFFSLLLRVQGGRMDEQRTELPRMLQTWDGKQAKKKLWGYSFSHFNIVAFFFSFQLKYCFLDFDDALLSLTIVLFSFRAVESVAKTLIFDQKAFNMNRVMFQLRLCLLSLFLVFFFFPSK